MFLLVMGPIMRDTINEVTLANHLNKITNYPLTEEIKEKAVSVFAFALAISVANLIYFIYAYDIDQLKWPTLVAISVFVLRLVFIRSNKEEYEPVQKYSAMRIFKNLIWLTYYSYMLSYLM
ncbi:hypothetical protein M7775_18175 [Sporomusa sphaeroides DSM 2875]|uniref:hypothetical protein n=1 Tax=Sporomusa sphaeroides TaxID=47679 RepID=UPI0020300E54|nr:hypothetical protein [Sporomusa sphaeroides]MCM0760484.1 hypothetical protein [Sporomusa sphaeroides DSM 2875]